ncbi:MAG TPA: hemolysin family protein [Vicinamibacterales bacterium]|nr:hemolysin family protein [Vicinamibacterales bacterium]
MTLTAVLLLSLLFVALNGLFVSAEFALIASPRPSLERRSSQGDSLARRVLAVLTSPVRQDRYVATAQIGISLASLGLGMYGEHELARHFERLFAHVSIAGEAALATTLALLVLTVAHIVLGEMVPKGVALQDPERVARIAHWPMQTMLFVLFPVVALSNAIARLCLRLVGIRRQQNAQEQVYTPEELQLIVEESQRGGAIRDESAEIVRELLEFGDLSASQAMVPRVRVVGIPAGATPQQLRRIVLENRRTRYVVYDGDLDHVVGVVHAKDLLRCLLDDRPLTATAVRRIPVVPETASLDDVLATLQRDRAHVAAVIDEHGGTAGIIGLEDLFEEVVGDIDEGVPALSITALPDGSARVAGTVRLDELGRHFDLDIEHEEVESVSGLVLAELGRPPVVGDVVEHGRLRLAVTATSGRGVKEVRASVLPVEHNEGA